jgi:hypothetical protein
MRRAPRGLLTSTAVLVITLLVGVGRAGADAADVKHQEAARLVAVGDYPRALEVIDEALAIAPGRLALLQLRARTLLEMRDYEAALEAYEAVLAAGVKGANKRAAQRIVRNLSAVRTTSLDLTVAGATEEDPASVYLDTRSFGVFCLATPRCKRGLPPGDYKLIVERPGYVKLTERVKIAQGKSLVLERALAEQPSAVSIAVAGSAPATVALDGAALGDAPQAFTVGPGEHVVEVRAAGHVTERATFIAQRGQPVELTWTLRPLIPVIVNAAGAEVLLGDEPAPREDGALALPAGAVTLTVRAPGYRTRTVEVPADRGDGYRLDVVLALAPAPLTVEGAPPGAVVTVDGREVGTVPLDAPLEVEQGRHTIGVRAARRAPFTTEVEVGSDAPLRLEVTRMPSTRRRWTWVAAAGTGAALISWSAFGVLALQKEGDFDDRAVQPGVTRDDEMLGALERDGDTYATIADVSMGVTLAGAAVTTWLFLREGKAASEGRIVPVVGPGAVGVGGSF